MALNAATATATARLPETADAPFARGRLEAAGLAVSAPTEAVECDATVEACGATAVSQITASSHTVTVLLSALKGATICEIDGTADGEVSLAGWLADDWTETELAGLLDGDDDGAADELELAENSVAILLMAARALSASPAGHARWTHDSSCGRWPLKMQLTLAILPQALSLWDVWATQASRHAGGAAAKTTDAVAAIAVAKSIILMGLNGCE